MQLLLVLHQLVPPVELLHAQIAMVLGLLAVELHVRRQVVLVLEPALADLALILGCLAALYPQMALQTGSAHVEAATVRALVGGLPSRGPNWLVYALILRLR